MALLQGSEIFTNILSVYLSFATFLFHSCRKKNWLLNKVKKIIQSTNKPVIIFSKTCLIFYRTLNCYFSAEIFHFLTNFKNPISSKFSISDLVCVYNNMYFFSCTPVFIIQIFRELNSTARRPIPAAAIWIYYP